MKYSIIILSSMMSTVLFLTGCTNKGNIEETAQSIALLEPQTMKAPANADAIVVFNRNETLTLLAQRYTNQFSGDIFFPFNLSQEQENDLQRLFIAAIQDLDKIIRIKGGTWGLRSGASDDRGNTVHTVWEDDTNLSAFIATAVKYSDAWDQELRNSLDGTTFMKALQFGLAIDETDQYTYDSDTSTVLVGTGDDLTTFTDRGLYQQVAYVESSGVTTLDTISLYDIVRNTIRDSSVFIIAYDGESDRMQDRNLENTLFELGITGTPNDLTIFLVGKLQFITPYTPEQQVFIQSQLKKFCLSGDAPMTVKEITMLLADQDNLITEDRIYSNAFAVLDTITVACEYEMTETAINIDTIITGVDVDLLLETKSDIWGPETKSDIWGPLFDLYFGYASSVEDAFASSETISSS